ncbi:MAG TPA: hypothetical protein VMU81_03105 [Acetobacteraceae bacterium]|jgi:hypothetical protein|nr:hypothetical protein [Acetobacteraceae bacterium]
MAKTQSKVPTGAAFENWIRPELGARGASTRRVDAKGRTTFLKLHTPPQPYFEDD